MATMGIEMAYASAIRILTFTKQSFLSIINLCFGSSTARAIKPMRMYNLKNCSILPSYGGKTVKLNSR